MKEKLGNRRGSLPDGVDVRGVGGWIVAPGSVRPDGAAWRPADSSPSLSEVFPASVPALPTWIADLICNRSISVAPPPQAAQRSISLNSRSREASYAAAALDQNVTELASTKCGSRNNSLNAIAYRMGRMIERGWIDRQVVANALSQACEANGLATDDGPTAVRATIESGLVAGAADPHQDLAERSNQLAPKSVNTDADGKPRLRVVTGGRGETDESPQPAITPADDDAEISRLAKLNPIEYERQRKDSAKRLGMRESILDKVVAAAKGGANEKPGQGKPLAFPELEQWPTPVDGIALLSELVAGIWRYVVLDEGEAVAVALWVLHCHSFNAFNISPRLAITSPEKQCGKTTLLDVLSCLVPRALVASNTSTSSIFRAIESACPTLLIDEADTFLGDNDELRGVLNSGHRKGGGVLRNVGDDHEPRMFSTWAPAAIAMIGRLPDTLEDRSIIVRLRRRRSDEKVTRFRLDRVDDLQQLARKASRWATDHFAELSKSDPDVPDALHNRAADNWRPLLAIADQAAGGWPKRAREVAQAAVTARNDQSNGVLLLGDIRVAFLARGTDRFASEELTGLLVGLEERPWAEFKAGKPLTKTSLSRMLGQFGIISGTIRLASGKTPKGYHLQAFNDAFIRYLPEESATPPQGNSRSDCGVCQSATPIEPVALSEPPPAYRGGALRRCGVFNPPSGEGWRTAAVKRCSRGFGGP